MAGEKKRYSSRYHHTLEASSPGRNCQKVQFLARMWLTSQGWRIGDGEVNCLIGEAALGSRSRRVFIADGCGGADFHGASEYMGRNVGTVGLVA